MIIRFIVPAAVTAAVIAACGGSSSTGSRASSSKTTSSTQAPGGAAASLPLATSELPAGSEAWTQITDAPISNTTGTDQRAWANADHTIGLEVDVYLVESENAAAGALQGFTQGALSKLSSLNQGLCPEGMPSDCTEATGTMTDGKAEIVLLWSEKNVLLASLEVTQSGTNDRTYVEQVAVAQDMKVAAS